MKNVNIKKKKELMPLDDERFRAYAECQGINFSEYEQGILFRYFLQSIIYI